jgi:hypothetical protein
MQMKPIWTFVMGIVIGTCMPAMSKPYEEFYSRAEEDKWVSFVEAHPGNDYAIYRMREDVTNGMTMINFAAGRNYYRLLDVMEQSGGAIRRYEIPENNASPLTLAMLFEADEAVDMLLKTRPEWANRFDPVMGSSPIYVAMTKTNIAGVELLLDHGADVDSVDGMTGQTLLQNAALRSPEMYELVRRHGGRQNQGQYLFRWKPEIREALVNKYSTMACSAYPDRMVFASGATVYYPGTETVTNALGQEWAKYLPLPQSAADVLRQELSAVGLRGSGTILINCHAGSQKGLARWVEPCLTDLNLAAIYVSEEDRSLSPGNPDSYVPSIQGASPE